MLEVLFGEVGEVGAGAFAECGECFGGHGCFYFAGWSLELLVVIMS